MSIRCLFRAAIAKGSLVLSLGGALGCSSSDRPPFAEEHAGLGCGRGVRRCDIHHAGCRQDVLDAVACLRNYDEQVPQPDAHFIRLSDLLQAPDSGGVDTKDRDLRLGYSLFGLVGGDEVDGAAAQAAQADNVAALYSSTDKAVYVLEDPGGEDLTQSQLGVPLDVYFMGILAHEYVHFLQDREFDLEAYSEQLSERFDPALAGVSAVEGEAMLYEGFFNYAVAGVSATDERVFGELERYVDYAEEQIRDAASPALEARMLFPYTYGAYSNAVLHQEGGLDALAELRDADSTLEFVQRRWGTVQRIEPFELRDPELADLGFEKLGDEQFGAWLVSAFWSRTLGTSTSDALDVALVWRGDRLGVWRHPDSGEILGNWVIEFDSQGGLEPQIAQWASALADARTGTSAAWSVRAVRDRVEITTSTVSDSAAVRRFAEESSANSGASDAGASDAGSETLERETSTSEPKSQNPTLDSGAGDDHSPDSAVTRELLQAAPSRQLLRSGSAASTRLRLPGPSSIAHRLLGQERIENFVRRRPSPLW